jgi:hypothetical protein
VARAGVAPIQDAAELRAVAQPPGKVCSAAEARLPGAADCSARIPAADEPHSRAAAPLLADTLSAVAEQPQAEVHLPDVGHSLVSACLPRETRFLDAARSMDEEHWAVTHRAPVLLHED